MSENEANKIEFVKMKGINRLMQLKGNQHLQENILHIAELYWIANESLQDDDCFDNTLVNLKRGSTHIEPDDKGYLNLPKEESQKENFQDVTEKKEGKNIENLHITGHFLKMAKGFRGMFGISDEKKEDISEMKDENEEDVKETSIEENIGENLSEEPSNKNLNQEEFPPSFNVLRK